MRRAIPGAICASSGKPPTLGAVAAAAAGRTRAADAHAPPGGVHTNANKKNKRFEHVRKRLRVEKRKRLGTRATHLAKVASVTGPARTGKAARRIVRQDRRDGKAALVRACCAAAPKPYVAATG